MHLVVVISFLSMRIFLHSTSPGSQREFLSQAFVRIIIILSLIQCSLAFREGLPTVGGCVGFRKSCGQEAGGLGLSTPPPAGLAVPSDAPRPCPGTACITVKALSLLRCPCRLQQLVALPRLPGLSFQAIYNNPASFTRRKLSCPWMTVSTEMLY